MLLHICATHIKDMEISMFLYISATWKYMDISMLVFMSVP